MGMFDRAYMDIQKVLDEELGTDEEDGASEGIVADILLALDKREKRGAVKALRREAERGMEAVENAAKMDTPNRDFALALMRGLARELDHRASLIESGEVTLP